MPACKSLISNTYDCSSFKSNDTVTRRRGDAGKTGHRVSPSPRLSPDAAFELHPQKPLRFDSKFHRQLQKYILTETVNNQRDGVFLRNAALLEIEQLLFADLRS